MQEVANIVYSLLVKMKYLKPETIAYPPHTNPSINTTLTAALGTTAESTLLLQMLPYVTSLPRPFYTWDENLIMTATKFNAYRYEP
jgi:hypothetical protein